MTEIEREFTFLVNELPERIDEAESRIIEDNYLPREAVHPVVRVRRSGDKYTITKKYPVDSEDELSGDSSRQVEHTITALQSRV